jgi:nucleotide-binding universal stress UspA family protein
LTVVTPDRVAAASRRQTLGNSVLAGATIRGTTDVGPALTAASWSAAVGQRWAATGEALERSARERLEAMADVEARVSVGSLQEELLGFADQVDLLVTGSRGHGSLRRLFLGSTSAYLARSAHCPLLVLPRAVAARSGDIAA